MGMTTILIVEDEAIVAADLSGKLRRLGYEVCGTASEGEEAVALACSLRPHLVLMDIRLEGSMDGIEAAEAICRRLDVPVIYLTAHSDAATLARAKLTGPFGYILKPFEERELATQIELAIYKHQADRQVREQREWLRVTLTSIGDAVIATDGEGRITFINPVAETLTGWKAEEATGTPLPYVFRIVNEQTGQAIEDPVARVFREGHAVPLANHAALVTRDDRTVPIEDSAAPILDVAGQVIGVVLVFHDVTEKRCAEEERETTVEFLRLVNQSSGTSDLVRAAAAFFQQQSGCEAVGIRLKKGDDYPYFEARGFPRGFVEMENSLCARDAAGNIIRDSAGNPYIECMCGNVICGRVDPSRHFFSPGGSFWTNDTTRLLATTSDADRQTRTRNRCNGEGYESVALIPLQSGVERTGLLQLNDRRKGMFTPQIIALWERLGGYLAVALAKSIAEKSMRESEEFNRRIIESSSDCIIVLDIEGNLLSISSGGQRLLEIDDISPFLNSPWIKLWKEADRPMVAEAITAARREGRGQFQAFCPSGRGKPMWWDVVITPIRDAQGNPERLLCISRDITERKQMEEDLRKSRDELELRVRERTAELRTYMAKLEMSNQSLQDFASIASHDMQEPLRKVISFGNMLRQSHQDSLGKTGIDYLNRMIGATERMQTLLTSLLEYSRVTTKQEPFQEVDLYDIIQEVLSDLEVRISKTGGEVQVGELPSIKADPTQMRQLFQNLIGNALKFHREAEKPLVRVSGSMAGDGRPYHKILIEDNGLGFEEKYLDKIFAPFQRLHGRTSQYEGTGIGLAICKKIVERHGGSITAQSTPGVGSIFVIILPVNPRGI